VYSAELAPDKTSPVGKMEVLEEVDIKAITDTWKNKLIQVPPLTLDYGLYKFVYKFEVDTGEVTIPFFKEAYTYVNVTKSPLVPVLMEGSPSKVSRGWNQALTMVPGWLSSDPDNPGEKVTSIFLINLINGLTLFAL
jgi:hypothetical protein